MLPFELPSARKTHLAIIHDLLMAAISLPIACYLRLGDELAFAGPFLWLGVPFFVLVAGAVFYKARLYRGIWRYASIQDAIAITKAVTIAILAFVLLMFIYNRLEGMPRSVPFIHWGVLLMMLAGPRFLYRVLKDKRLSFDMAADYPKIPVLLVGINDHAELFLRDVIRSARAPYRVIGIIDAGKGRVGREIWHIPVMGNIDEIERIIEDLRSRGNAPQKLVISPDSVSGAKIRNLLEVADRQGLSLARLPKLTEFKEGVADGLQLRPIAIEDLLGRPQANLDRESMRQLVSGRRILVTGAGGTIGGELVRQIANYNPSHLALLDISEFNLYQIDKELEEKCPQISKRPLIGDVRNPVLLERIFSEIKPELIFHAAALKHVPLAEQNVIEAVTTNILGTRCVAECAIRHNALGMVLISTDKAVNPSSVMGVTKRIAELLCHAMGEYARTGTRFVTVRFGNVLGSAGSVVPLFARQLAAGGPLTVTHPEMTRYFMTVREAVELVLQTSALAIARRSGHAAMMVLDMGEPIRIEDLALQMIRLSGLRPYQDIEVVHTGLRPGEKLHEELFYPHEEPKRTEIAEIFEISPCSVTYGELAALIKNLEKQVDSSNIAGITAQLKTIVPEFHHPNLEKAA